MLITARERRHGDGDSSGEILQVCVVLAWTRSCSVDPVVHRLCVWDETEDWDW